jgi:5-oxoprolinase (ATP-hydrolysing) subunit A
MTPSNQADRWPLQRADDRGFVHAGAYHPGVRIDLNADVGEGFGAWTLGEDETLIPVVSSVNVACGFHAGDPRTMERTVARAVAARVAIGAHPGYPDLAGFGRRDLDLALPDLEAAIVYQVGALAAFARAASTDLRHVKAHGALYNRAARDPATAEALARAVKRVSAELVVVALAGSIALDAARSIGLSVAAEGFADRAYEANGRLRSRTEADAVIDDPAACAAQALSIARDDRLGVDTLCVHGDRPGATGRATAVRAALEGDGIEVRPLDPRPA